MKYVQSHRYARWPTLTLKWWVLTVDFRGNIIWPTKFSPETKALLTELARRKVQFFLEHMDQYPIRADFSRTPGSSSTQLEDGIDSPQIPSPQTPQTPQ